MTNSTLFGGDEIRKASRTTAVLQVFAVLLLAILVSVYVDISSRQGDLRDAVRENAMWSVYQFNRETQDLHHKLELMIASGNEDSPALRDLALRYDIVYSRMKTLRETKFDQNFLVDKDVSDQLEKIERIIFVNQPIFDAMANGESVSEASLKSRPHQTSNRLTHMRKMVAGGGIEPPTCGL